MTRPDLRILAAPNLPPADLEREIEENLKMLKQEYHPGLAGEIMFPDAENIDPKLLEWKNTDDVKATGGEILYILSRLNEYLRKHDIPVNQSARFASLCAKLDQIRANYQSAVELHAAQWVKEQFARMKDRENFLTFDDLLNGVLQAVRDPPILSGIWSENSTVQRLWMNFKIPIQCSMRFLNEFSENWERVIYCFLWGIRNRQFTVFAAAIRPLTGSPGIL